MALRARSRKMAGSSPPKALTVAASGTIEIGNNGYEFILTAASAISLAATAITFPTARPGRRIRLIGTSDTNTVTVVHTATASRASGTITGTGNIILGLDDECELKQRTDGSWTVIGTNLVS